MALKGLKELDFKVWDALRRLYLSDPLTHCYLMYDLIYELERTDIWSVMDDEGVSSYLLVWRGMGGLGLHIWRYNRILPLKSVLSEAKGKIVLHLYSKEDLKALIPLIEDMGLRYEVKWFKDMVVESAHFKPLMERKAVRLNAKEHLVHFLRLKSVQGRELGEEEAMRLIERWRYYGIFEGGELVAIACRYIALPEVWVIGDVYTHPAHRGKGFAKAVTSAITRDALASGASALLHVDRGNTPALRVYERLGYIALRERPWVLLHKK